MASALSAYLSYLSKHPDGKYINAVKELISDTGEEYYDYLIREVASVRTTETMGQRHRTVHQVY